MGKRFALHTQHKCGATSCSGGHNNGGPGEKICISHINDSRTHVSTTELSWFYSKSEKGAQGEGEKRNLYVVYCDAGNGNDLEIMYIWPQFPGWLHMLWIFDDCVKFWIYECARKVCGASSFIEWLTRLVYMVFQIVFYLPSSCILKEEFK